MMSFDRLAQIVQKSDSEPLEPYRRPVGKWDCESFPPNRVSSMEQTPRYGVLCDQWWNTWRLVLSLLHQVKHELHRCISSSTLCFWSTLTWQKGLSSMSRESGLCDSYWRVFWIRISSVKREEILGLRIDWAVQNTGRGFDSERSRAVLLGTNCNSQSFSLTWSTLT